MKTRPAVEASARPRVGIPAVFVSARVELSFSPACTDSMPFHPNGRIKTNPPHKQPQVRFVHEVQMKQS